MKNLLRLSITILFASQLFSCAKQNSTEKPVERTDAQIKMVTQMAGQWHNECMEIGLNDSRVKAATNLAEKKIIVRELISEFCAKKLEISKAEAMETIIKYESLDYDLVLSKCDQPRKEILLKLKMLYKTANTASDLVKGIESLEIYSNNTLGYDPTIATVLNISKNSVLYWKDKRLENSIGGIRTLSDPLTPRQREIMNADGEGGAVGGVWGMWGGPWSAVVGAFGGAVSGSLYHAIFK